MTHPAPHPAAPNPYLPPQRPGVYTARGYNGTITFDGHVVSIVRTGFMARATVGKGEKRIPLRHITAVQMKPAGSIMNGFIAFTVAGGVESRSRLGRQTSDATRDENAVTFHYGQRHEFDQLRGVIEQALAYGPPQPPPQAPRVDPVAQLGRLAELYRSGALTDVEYAQAKAALLGRM